MERLSRKRRSKKIKKHIYEIKKVRLTVYRTLKHIYAQIFNEEGNLVIVAASSLEKKIKNEEFNNGKLDTSKAVGKLIAERAKKNGVFKVAFDRSGFKYHGRIKALADGARENGLKF